MSVYLLRKTALLMGDLHDINAKKKTASKTETPMKGKLDPKFAENLKNGKKLVKFSAKEKRTRQMIENLRNKRQGSNDSLVKKIAKVQRFSAKIDRYAKKAFANDLVRERIFKDQDFVSVKSQEDDAQQSAFTEEDFKRFEEEYSIKYTGRAKDREEIRRFIK